MLINCNNKRKHDNVNVINLIKLMIKCRLFPLNMDSLRSHVIILIIIIGYFPYPDHNSEQARLARLPYQPSELGQKLPLQQVAKITVMFCFLVSE